MRNDQLADRLDGHKTMRDCIESLIRRLETIKETNPELHVDRDIDMARAIVAKADAPVERGS